MKKWKQRGFAFVLALSLTTGLLTGAQAAVSKETLNDAVQDTAEYMCRTVQDPQVGSIGGEWAVLGLARSGYDVPDSYYQDYYATVEAYVKACDGKLDPLCVRDFCDFCGYTESEFWKIMDKFYNRDLFEKNDCGEWVLKHPIWEENK